MIPHFAQFERYLTLERNYSAHTLRAYLNDIEQLGRFLVKRGLCDQEGRVSLSQVDHLTVRAFLGELYREKINSSSASRKLSAIRTFFKFLKREGFIEENRVELVSSPKKEKTVPAFLTIDEIYALLGITQGGDPLSIRNRAMIELLYATGVRVAELVSLNLGRVNIRDRFIRVIGKGDKERIIPIGSQAAAALENYLQNRNVLLNRGERGDVEALFINHRGGRLTDRGVRDILTRLIKKGAMKKNVSPHSIRHSFATHMLNAGANLRTVQELLGHASLSSTQIYTHLELDRLMSVYDDAHPRASKGRRIRSTTVLAVRHKGRTVMAGDGQVSVGEVIMKHSAKKVRKLYHDKVLAGFAGAAADAFALFARFESKLEEHHGNLPRAAVEMAKDWRTDRVLRRLEALLTVVDHNNMLIVSGTGDIIEPDHQVIGIGSGGAYAQAAALALLGHSELDAEEIVREAMHIAASICIYTNDSITVQEL